MSRHNSLSARRVRFMHRYHARRSAFTKAATGFVSNPEPRTIGHFARGRQLIAGNFLFAGFLVEAPKTMLWDIPMPDHVFEEDLHGFRWLDDLASVGDAKARERVQGWTFDWIDRFGRGKGAGWIPDLTGRRMIRWTNHALLILRGQDKETSDKFFKSMAHQTVFLSKRWKTASAGLPRFEALTGLIYAGLSLENMSDYVTPAIAALAKECDAQVDEEGGIPTRNPEELLDVFLLLTWAASALSEADQTPPPALMTAIDRIAPTLRTLRHSDGGLARFHGGGRGLDGWLDHALALSGNKTVRSEGLHMGFARMTAGRTSVIVDASSPPSGGASYNGHASTLAFELTSGRRPLIVNCGSGASFGETWRRAGRATPSHSTLGIEGYSSSRLGDERVILGRMRELLTDIPDNVLVEVSALDDGNRLEAGHNGYVVTHGLTHARTIDMMVDGRAVAGEDILTTLSDADKMRFDRAMDATGLQGIDYSIRFHLHPEVDAELDMGGNAVSLAQKSGEVWVFRHDGNAVLKLEPSVYLENGRLKPRGSKQIVLSARAMSYSSRVRWSLAKAQDTPVALRDLNRDDLDVSVE